MSASRALPIQDHRHWLLPSAGAALLILRVSLECAPPRPWWGAAAAVACMAVAFLLRSAPVSLTPLSLAWVYVLWPALSPGIALSITFVALIALLVHNLDPSPWPPFVIDGVVFGAALLLYICTLAPTMLPADSGEFQIVGPVLGVAHPPGYALFTMLGKLFSLLPLGETAWRVNLMGAVTGAMTLLVVGRTARELTGSVWAGIAAAGALGLSTTFWAQSTTINIRALIVLFTALCTQYAIRLISAPAASPAGKRSLTGLAASFGLLVAHHYPQAAFAPVLALLVLWHDPGIVKRVRQWPRYLAALFIPFAADLYIVARAIAGAPFGTDSLTTPRRVIDHLLGRGFSGDMFAFLRFDRVLWERTLAVGNILYFQFGTALLVLSVAGFLWLAWRQHKQAVLLGGVFLVIAFIVATYRAPQSVEYLMPAYVPVALAVGCTVPLVMRLSPSSAGRALLVALILLPMFLLGRANLPSYLALGRDRSTRTYAEGVLLDAPSGAHILANWHWYTSLRYLQLVEGRRPDVQVTYLYPQGATAMPQAWPQRIEHELQTADRPLVVTNFYDTYRDLSYRFPPQGEAFLIQSAQATAPPPDLTFINADLGGADRIRILGYRPDMPAEVRPGDWIAVDLAWQPLEALERGYAFTVQLVGPDGVPVGQYDRPHNAAPTYTPGEVLLDRYRFPLFLTAAPGRYRLIAAAYYTLEEGGWARLTLPDGSDTVTLAEIAVLPTAAPPVTTHPLYRHFAGGPTLVGVDYDDTLPGQRRVYLHWRTSAESARVVLLTSDVLLSEKEVPPSVDGGYVTTVHDLPAGADRLNLAVRSPTTDAPLPAGGGWGLRRVRPLSLPRPHQVQHYLPFGAKLALVGAQFESAWPAGQTQRVALRFLGLRPIVLDYVVTVSVQGDGIALGPSDSVPALGAIPTFKWIGGSQVTDVHLVDVRDDAHGSGQLTLGVYDAFTSEALPALDERIARLGLPGVPLGPITVP